MTASPAPRISLTGFRSLGRVAANYGVGANSFATPFFFNAQAAMNASSWSMQGGDLWVQEGYKTTPDYCPPPGDCVFQISPNWIDLGSLGSSYIPFTATLPTGPGAIKAGARVSAAPRPSKPPFKDGCAGTALLEGLKAAAVDFVGAPPNSSVLDSAQDLAKDDNAQRLAIGVFYEVGAAARTLSPLAEIGVKFVPFVGEAVLAYQVGKALYEGGKAYAESIDRCNGGE